MSTDEHKVWVLENVDVEGISDHTLERLGDARRLADALACKVGVLLVGTKRCDTARLCEHGADQVLEAVSDAAGPTTRAATAVRYLLPLKPRLVLAAGTPDGTRVGRAPRRAHRVAPVLALPARRGDPRPAQHNGAQRVCSLLSQSDRGCKRDCRADAEARRGGSDLTDPGA